MSQYLDLRQRAIHKNEKNIKTITSAFDHFSIEYPCFIVIYFPYASVFVDLMEQLVRPIFLPIVLRVYADEGIYAVS
jgi:hypothetical protein